MGCKFCESGRLKKVRNLNTYEMVMQILLIEEDIKTGSRENEIYTSLNQYMSIIKKHIKKNNNLFNIKSDSDCTEIADKIGDYIMRQIYIHVYPKEELQSEINELSGAVSDYMAETDEKIDTLSADVKREK